MLSTFTIFVYILISVSFKNSPLACPAQFNFGNLTLQLLFTKRNY